ncbi:polyhydroxyalkanoic acid system family protein [Croceicoccus gelatinilyticus]|uniref:polyhydroxyalkanoic acid system family protein n=1 Tax=Croceicoccus gelatinilyticus TaxID=2835536 RepID=UPI001BCBD40E|nr:polyhydroxyalkanoic acid system family protein [Croceicoccus gelatinilyticus]MBS7670750.1 polyhydroxyalkanoic acid system family protein [Croceicoccus gelatinilyticus]
MRVAVPHSLPKAEVRRRLDDKQDSMTNLVPGGMAEIETSWASEDRMIMTIRAMGQEMTGNVDIEDEAVVFTIDLPFALSFVEPMISGAIEQKGRKLLS